MRRTRVKCKPPRPGCGHARQMVTCTLRMQVHPEGDRMIQEIPNIYWLAVLAAAILRIVVGSIWFSPIGFVKPWQKLTGVTPEGMQRGLVRAIVIDFVLSLIMAFENRSFRLIMIGTGSNLVSMLLMGVLFGLWH